MPSNQFNENGVPNILQNGENYTKFNCVQLQPLSHRGEKVGKIYSTWISGLICFHLQGG